MLCTLHSQQRILSGLVVRVWSPGSTMPTTELCVLTASLQGKLDPIQSEDDLTAEERLELVKLFHSLKGILSRNSRVGDWASKKTEWKPLKEKDDFSHRFRAMVKEFQTAEDTVQAALQNPMAVQPMSLEAIQERVSEFFILDNSLRETTVGQPRGHTLEEKQKIVHAMAETGLEEVILGAFGSKISVDSQITEQWLSLGKSFDKTWGFSEAYDMEPIDEDPLWVTEEDFDKPKTASDYYTPAMNPKSEYDKKELHLFKRASKGFQKHAFGRFNKLGRVLKKSESHTGRIPLGLLMMAGYGICNAIIEIDTSLETFDYQTFDIVERLKLLIGWCKENFAKRSDGQSTRVLINLRDFSNYHRSAGGLEMALRVVDALSRLPTEDRPFGFIMEEPTGWLFPSEVGKIVRMIRVTMDRAGFPEGQLLVHVHWYFGLAEATVLSCMVNGATGVWAAVCKAGAQTGHACSTMTAVNLFRAGHQNVTDQYNLAKMCQAARTVTALSTRQPCPSHEEIYGKDAFDIPYFMTSLPSCRYSIYHVLTKLGVRDRAVRLNELSMVSSVYNAMVYHFGPPEKMGWDPRHCRKMHEALHNHLLTGLSRDYNTALGLGHLYSLVSKEKLPGSMVYTMTENCPITDQHPVVLDFIYRWNRLCATYQDKEQPPHPASISKSHMFWGLSLETQPSRLRLPFEVFTADVMRNPVLEPFPRLFKLQVVNLLTMDERQIQGTKIPQIKFYETVLRLKLFLQEADSLHVMGLVDDFCIRKNHDYFFGEDALWLKKVRHKRGGGPPKIANKVLLNQMKFYHKHYIDQGDTAISRCIESIALRIDEHRAVPTGMQDMFRSESARHLIHEIADRAREGNHYMEEEGADAAQQLTPAHENILRALAEDDGEDEELAAQFYREFSSRFLGLDDDVDDEPMAVFQEEGEEESLADAYIRERRESFLPGAVIQSLDDEQGGMRRQRSRRGSKQGALIRMQGSLSLARIISEHSELSSSKNDDNAIEEEGGSFCSCSNSSSDESAEIETMLAPTLFRGI